MPTYLCVHEQYGQSHYIEVTQGDTFMPRPIERRLDWVFYKTEMKIWAVGCRLGWTVLKKVWADYEQLLRVCFSTFCGQKKKKNLKTL